MTIQQVIRMLERSERAAQKDAERARREAERQAIENYKVSLRYQQEAHAMATAHAYNNYVRALVMYHHGGANFIDWAAILQLPAPSPPMPRQDMEQAARRAFENYKPTFTDRLLSQIEVRKSGLLRGIENARLSDIRMFDDAQKRYASDYVEWNEQRGFAQRILGRDSSLYAEVLGHCNVLSVFDALGTRITCQAGPDWVVLMVSGRPRQVVPECEVNVTATGKLSTKNMPAGKYWALVQDHVCSCALRLARDVFSVLPVSRVIVNIGEGSISSVTGHHETTTLLAVHFSRGAMMRVNLREVDPSDSMANFNYRMAFHKTKGFSPVEPISVDEQWVTAG